MVADRSPPSESPGILARKRWSYREDQRLLTLHDRGLSDPEIARALGRTSSSVQMRRLRLGIKLRRAPRLWSDVEERRLATAHKKGSPDAVIAQRLDRPVRAVEDRRHLLVWLRVSPVGGPCTRMLGCGGCTGSDTTTTRSVRSSGAPHMRSGVEGCVLTWSSCGEFDGLRGTMRGYQNW